MLADQRGGKAKNWRDWGSLGLVEEECTQDRHNGVIRILSIGQGRGRRGIDCWCQKGGMGY